MVDRTVPAAHSNVERSGSHEPKRIPLTRGFSAVVDAADYEWLSKYRWFASGPDGAVYAARTSDRSDGPRQIKMHREILQANPGMDVDHRNGNGLDNRRENLRQCSRIENSWNRKKHRRASSQFKGVCYMRDRAAWQAGIKINGRRQFLGHFASEEDAAKAYDAAAIALFGEFAKPNFQPPDGQGA